jgi:hypothetical protein
MPAAPAFVTGVVTAVAAFIGRTESATDPVSGAPLPAELVTLSIEQAVAPPG